MARRYLRVAVLFDHSLEFSEHICIANAKLYDKFKHDTPSAPSKAKGGRLAAAARMPTLWAPVARRLSVHSIRAESPNGDHHLVSGRVDVARALCSAWASTFVSAVNTIVGNAFLQRWGRNARRRLSARCSAHWNGA